MFFQKFSTIIFLFKFLFDLIWELKWKTGFFFQMNALKIELERLNEENRRLRNMLDQITKNYNELQGQLFMAVQKQALENQRNQQVIFDYNYNNIIIIIYI